MNRAKNLARRIFPETFLKIVEKIFRKGRGLFWQIRYGFPARKLRVIAVTGTNGKSTTCNYINEVLKAGGYKTAVLTTVFYEINGRREPNTTHFTISKQSIVQNFMNRAKNADVDWVVLEVTSHALDQDRIMGVPVRIAVITNLTQDHLDYHGTMENYAAAKARLLTQFGPGHAVLNADDKWYDFFRSRTSPATEVFSVGSQPNVTGRIGKIKLTKSGGSATFATKNHRLTIKTSLAGDFNVVNAAMAAAVGSIFLMEPKVIAKAIASVKSLEGRMERIPGSQPFDVYVDFAITPDAIEKALSSLQKTTKGKVRIVFGATGDRDKEKRPIMGEVAAKHADFIYLTDDETYTEDPESTRDAVYKGIAHARAEKKTKVIPDREEAIKAAMNDAQSGDVVLLAGIGHETERNMGGRQIPWSEKETAQKYLAKTKN